MCTRTRKFAESIPCTYLYRKKTIKILVSASKFRFPFGEWNLTYQEHYNAARLRRVNRAGLLQVVEVLAGQLDNSTRQADRLVKACGIWENIVRVIYPELLPDDADAPPQVH